MAVGAGKFKLYAHIDPVLSAGDYRFVATQDLDGDGGDAASMAVDTHHSHVRVRAPRYQLPPDQVLSTFPPAGASGSFGTRLPQVVIKRRTLPWERDLPGQPSSTPWLALVVIAEGEAELKLNQPVADCVTPGITLTGVADTSLGSALHVRRSVVHAVFPTQKDIPLLAHAREVDINDTELMMGDDDGFLSVVISNRLPLAGVDGAGVEQPVKYLACLVNLERQLGSLLPESPARQVTTVHPIVHEATTMSVADHDLLRMQVDTNIPLAGGSRVVLSDSQDASSRAERRGVVAHGLGEVSPAAVTTTGAPAYSGNASWTLDDAELVASTVYAEMAHDFAISAFVHPELMDPMLRFPVLLHWSFVSSGSTTFKQLMQELDSGLIGTVDPGAVAPDGREPLEVVETGHVGLVHRTRRGDRVRSWYRGPLVPHPPDATEERLPLAHVADQLRTVIPDGREDLSLAAAFEIGRLLALSHPSLIAAMLQWRQTNYHVARRETIWRHHHDFVAEITGVDAIADLANSIGLEIGRGFIRRLTADPDEIIGGPRPLVDPGRPLVWDRSAAETVAAGFGLDPQAFSGDLGAVLGRLKEVEQLPGEGLDPRLGTSEIRDRLHRVVDHRLVDLVSSALALEVDVGGIDRGPVSGPVIDPTVLGPTVPGTILRGGRIRPFSERFSAFDAETEAADNRLGEDG